MIGKIIKYILIFLLISFLLLHFGCLEAEAQQGDGDFQDNIGHTAIDGYSSTDHTSFNFDIRSRILHDNITLILYSQRDNSSYEVHAGDFSEDGTFAYRQELNFELQEGRQEFNIIIDDIQYRFDRTISEQAMPGEYQDEIERRDGDYYTEGQIAVLKRNVWLQAVIGVPLAFIPAYFLAKLKKEGEINEVIE